MSAPAPWAAHFGLKRIPFGKSIAAKDLFARQAHAEAVARINFCVVESALGVITGDVGAGKTVSVRAAVDALDRTRHQVIYIANPGPLSSDMRRDPALTEAELMKFVAGELTNYKRPKFVEFRDELPKTPVGKILRRALRDELVKQKAA